MHLALMVRSLNAFRFNLTSRLVLCSSTTHQNNYRRDLSLQSSIESFARTQSGVFKTLSESAPVECCQNLLVAVHDLTGLPWWGAIVCSTLILRTAVFPLAVYQNRIAGKVINLRFELLELSKELRFETAVAVKQFGWDDKTAKLAFNRSLRKQWKNLIVRENCHPAKGLIVAFCQIPLWISVSVALRNLVYMLPHQDVSAHVTFAQLDGDGFGWLFSLVQPDPLYILPVAMGLVNLLLIEVQRLSRVGERTRAQTIAINFFRGFCILTVPLAACLPSCLTLYWFTSSAYGLIQNLVLLSPRIRRVCRIPETKLELQKPYRHIYDALTGAKRSSSM